MSLSRLKTYKFTFLLALKTLFYQNFFILFQKNDLNSQKKIKNMSQVGVRKLGVSVFFTTIVVHGLLK